MTFTKFVFWSSTIFCVTHSSNQNKMSGIKRDKEKVQQIQVYVRLRPFSRQERDNRCLSCIEVVNSRELLVKHHHGKRYCFDGVFSPSAKQLTIYETIVKPLISEILAGYNCTVFAYGQTGTGKTYTMAGGSPSSNNMSWQDNEQAGIIPRAFAHLFDELRLIQQEHTVRVSYLELYNEELYDLLVDGNDSSRIRIFDDQRQKGSVIIQGIEEQTVHNKYEVYRILEKGEEKRRTASTLMNEHSTRSHTVFSITIHTRETTVEGEELVKTGKLNLVDLAGSENISRSGAVDRRAREAGNINQSLLNLGRVIKALVERTAHIPYRASKLTRLLQDSLGGRTKTSIIATISPATVCLDETSSTLEYANRARYIVNRPEVNQRMSQKTLMSQYVEEIERLRKDLSAARTGHGIYLASENYDRLITDQQIFSNELAEKVLIIRDLEQQLKNTEEQKLIVEEQWNELYSSFEKTNNELEDCHNALKQTITEKEEQEHLASFYANNAELLHEQAQALLNTTKSLTGNETLLHKKIEKLYSLAVTNSKTVKKMSATVASICCNTVEELTEFMDGFYKRNKFLIQNLQNLQKLQKDNYEVTASLISGANEHIKFASEEFKTKVENQEENVQIWINKLVSQCNGYIEIINNIQNLNSAQLCHYLEEIVTTEKQQHEEFCNKFEKKLTHMSATMCALSENVIINLDSLKNGILFELEKLLKDLNEQCKSTDDIMIQVTKWRSELQKAFDSGFKILYKKLQRSRIHEKENLQQANTIKNNWQSLISDFNKNVKKHIDDTVVNSVTSLKDIIEESRHQRPALLLWDKIMNNFNVDQQTQQQATTEQLQQLSKGITICSDDFIKENLQIFVDLRIMLEFRLNNIHTALQQQTLTNTELFSNLKSKSNEALKDITDSNVDITKHKMSLSSKLYNCQDNLTKFVNNEFIEVKHEGDTPVRSKYNYPADLKQLKPQDHILSIYRQMQIHKVRFLNESKMSEQSSSVLRDSLGDHSNQENILQEQYILTENIQEESSANDN